ncbi:hypothetical protein N7462_005779 [Penicillium macrosclerotiorum]|uniref:uncharacterized protein n=1 Tax=Penicillium macrosclerotiorum TaxID=303699 RepID=UPI00254974AF|nr:uncharacterized protein N7462_005779 [Penicillium macrosclerotiorum]KAJ5682614.1 hypothetical protein N7462_005779 [Penicillium macrosclerotiorum]
MSVARVVYRVEQPSDDLIAGLTAWSVRASPFARVRLAPRLPPGHRLSRFRSYLGGREPRTAYCYLCVASNATVHISSIVVVTVTIDPLRQADRPERADNDKRQTRQRTSGIRSQGMWLPLGPLNRFVLSPVSMEIQVR